VRRPPVSRGRRSGLPLPVRRRAPGRLGRQAALPGPWGLTVRVLRVAEPSRFPKAPGGQALTTAIGEIYARSRRTYGAPGVHGELARLGGRCGRKRVARLMRESGLAGVHARWRWRNARSGAGRAPDLVQRNSGPAGPDQLWAADVTQFRTGEGWLYLAAVIDLWSRRAIGWSTGNSATTGAGVPGPGHGRHPPGPAAAGDPPLRPGSGLHVAGVLAANHRTRAASVTGKDRRLLRQRRSRSLLRHLETRAGLDPPHRTMEHQRPAPHRPLRLHRGLLQPPAHPAQARASKPHRLRQSSQLKTPCPPKRVKPTTGRPPITAVIRASSLRSRVARNQRPPLRTADCEADRVHNNSKPGNAEDARFCRRPCAASGPRSCR
jgi:hypothetical protein